MRVIGIELTHLSELRLNSSTSKMYRQLIGDILYGGLSTLTVSGWFFSAKLSSACVIHFYLASP